MEHELLHSDRGDLDLRLNNKAKKDKEKTEPGERKKWNFRKTSTSESSGNDGPSTFGLINPSSESRSKKIVPPTMIFENALSDHDEPNDVQQVKSPPTSINLSQSTTPVTRVPPRTPSTDQGTNITRARQRSLPMSTSPPTLINRAQSARKADRIHRQVSVPTRQEATTLLQQQSLPSTFITPERPDLIKPINDLQVKSQWQPLPQPYFSPDNLSNVIKTTQENHKTRTLSDKDIAGVETLDNNNTMWQGNEEMISGNWADFLSPTNEVFVPGDQAWAGTDNVVVDVEDGGDVAPRNLSNSSRSSNSSESDNEGTEESVWRINDEQRAYYLNQFRILQPAEKGVVAGQKARDFFLKSELGTDVLSKIWNLADMDNDGALNFDEFCIAMHIVVAVRHGLEVPATLPPYLIPEKYETQAAIAQKVETNSNELSLQDSSKSWARFSPDPRNDVSETDGRMPQAVGSAIQPGPQHVTSAVQHVHSHGQHANQVNQHAHQASQLGVQSAQHTQQLRQHSQAEVTQHNQQVNQHTQPVAQQEQPVAQPSQPVAQHQTTAQPARRLERTMSDPSSADENTTKDNTHTPRKISLGIPRVRGQPKQTNLLDTPHWAILPPPSKFNKENPEETGKGGQFVPTGTIIHADPEDHSKLVKSEKTDQVLTGDSETDSSSSETEEKKKERVKSSSHEDSESSLSKNSSDTSLRVSQDSVDGGTKLSAPVPPPRRRSGHSRSSSLDLQKLFNKGANAASLQNAADFPKESMQKTEENFANFEEFNKFQTTTASHFNENISRPGHKRSASLDSAHAVYVEASPHLAENVEDAPNNRPEVSASVPRPVPKKKPASPPPPLLNIQKKEGQQDSGSDSVIEKEKKSKEPIRFVVKPLTRLEQLHAKIRDLKTKNTRLSRINNELQQELKEMMEKRVGLESSLEQLKPFAK